MSDSRQKHVKYLKDLLNTEDEYKAQNFDPKFRNAMQKVIAGEVLTNDEISELDSFARTKIRKGLGYYQVVFDEVSSVNNTNKLRLLNDSYARLKSTLEDMMIDDFAQDAKIQALRPDINKIINGGLIGQKLKSDLATLDDPRYQLFKNVLIRLDQLAHEIKLFDKKSLKSKDSKDEKRQDAQDNKDTKDEKEQQQQQPEVKRRSPNF